jgi:hypothetical protein
MNAAHVHSVFRGVVCKYCGRPIRLTSPFIKREMAIKNDDTKIEQLRSRVFLKRCRNCLKESLYDLDQISEFSMNEAGQGVRAAQNGPRLQR